MSPKKPHARITPGRHGRGYDFKKRLDRFERTELCWSLVQLDNSLRCVIKVFEILCDFRVQVRESNFKSNVGGIS
jgi:hypothetical protein